MKNIILIMLFISALSCLCLASELKEDSKDILKVIQIADNCLYNV